MVESPPSADVGWSMSYRRFSPSAGYQLHKPPLYLGWASLVVFGVGVMETCLSVQKLLISDGGTTGDGVAETCAVVWRNSISLGFKKFTAVVSVALVVCADCADCTACALYADCAACAAAL